MMPITPQKMVKYLKDNGFEELRQKGSHLVMRNPETGKQTVIPMHMADLPQGTERSILKQAGLQK